MSAADLSARLDALMRWLLDDGHMTPVATRQIRQAVAESLSEEIPAPDLGRVAVVADYLSTSPESSAWTDEHRHSLALGIVSALDTVEHARW